MFYETTTTTSTGSLLSWVDYLGFILLILFIIGWYYFARFKAKLSRKWVSILFIITFFGGIALIIITFNLTSPIFLFVGIGMTFMGIYAFWVLYRTFLHPRQQEEIDKIEKENTKKSRQFADEALNEGILLYNQEKYTKAVDKFIDVIKWDQMLITPWIYLTKISIHRQKDTEARYFLKNAHRIDPENEEIKQLRDELEKRSHISTEKAN